jgi:predicted phosphodiesterase
VRRLARLAVLSDIHGNLPALEAVLADAAERGVDQFVNLGDIASGPLWPRETVARLMALGWPTISGNHERQLLHDPDTKINRSDRYARAELTAEQKTWFAGLPGTLWLGDVFLCHGTPASDNLYWLETLDAGAPTPRQASSAEVGERVGGVELGDASLVLCGHTHVARSLGLGEQTLVVNPGSVGLPGFDHDYPGPHVVEAGSPHARYAIVERTARGWDVTFRHVVYDWHVAARRAAENGRPEWARALATGRVA